MYKTTLKSSFFLWSVLTFLYPSILEFEKKNNISLYVLWKREYKIVGDKGFVLKVDLQKNFMIVIVTIRWVPNHLKLK